MAGVDTLGIGRTGLLAFQRTLSTISHNIVNANTDGYSRQRVELGTRPPQYFGAGFMGTGVQVQSVERLHNAYIEVQLRGGISSSGQLDSFYSFAARVDNLLADPQAGLTPMLESFFGSLSDVADDSASLPPRQVLVSEAGSLVQRFHFLDQRLDDIRIGVNTDITATVNEINGLAQSLAKINRDIVYASSQGSGEMPNDLLDKRDNLVKQLSERVSARTLLQDDGALNVFIGNGQTLVTGFNARELSTVSSQYDSSRLEVAYDTGNGFIEISSQLSGGTLGGTLQFRSQVLDPARNALGRVAMGLADRINDQHQLGMDLNGNLGGLFFNDIYTSSPEVMASSRNTGLPLAQIDANVIDVSQLTTSDYRLDFDGANFSLTRLIDNVVVATATAASFTGGTPIVADGVELNYSGGGFNVGDRFLVKPTYSASRNLEMALVDPATIAAAAPIRTSAGFANIGNGEISAGVVVPPAPPNADLLQPVTITFTSPTTYDITGVGAGLPSAGNVYDPATGATVTVNGWTAELSGAPQTGDTFMVEPNYNGVSDNRNMLLLAQLQDSNIFPGNATFQQAYGQMVADVGIKTRQADIAAEAQHTLVQQLQMERESVSGVNLDEEAANLVRFQQAYEAAAQVMNVASDLFDTLLGALGR